MKRLTVLFSFLLVLLGTVAAVPVAEAATGQAGDLVTVNRGETVNDDLYAAGETVTISGTVRGDVVVAGSEVLIEGRVTGNVWSIGSNVRITGNVGGSVRAAGEEVSVSGTVGRDVVALGSRVVLAQDGRISGDLIAFGGSVRLLGNVGRDVRVDSGTVVVAGTVSGSIDANVGDGGLQLTRTARVSKGIQYTASEELSQAKGARVGGTIDFTKESEQNKGESFLDRLNGQTYWFLASLLLLLGILLYARRAAVRASELVSQRLGVSFLAGVVFLLATPILAFVLLLSIVGIPLSLFTLLGYALVLYTAKVFVALAVGGLALRGKTKPDKFWPVFGAGSLGLALFYVLAAIPTVGMVVCLAVVIVGSGAQLLLFKELYAANRKKYGS